MQHRVCTLRPTGAPTRLARPGPSPLLPVRRVVAYAAASDDEGDASFDSDGGAASDADDDGSRRSPASRRTPAAPRSRLEAKQSTRLRSQLRAMLPDPVDDPLFDAAALLTTDDDDGEGDGGAGGAAGAGPAPTDSLADPTAAGRRRRRARAVGEGGGGGSGGGGALEAAASPAARRRPPPDLSPTTTRSTTAATAAAAAATPPPPRDAEAIAHALTGGYHRLHEVALAQEAAMALLTDQRGRGVSVYGQTVAMAGLMKALDARRRPPGEEFLPDWVVATFGLERCWGSLAAVEAARSERTALQEAWAPGRELQAAVGRGDAGLLAGAAAATPACGDWGEDAGAAYDDLLAGVLPGVVEEGGGGEGTGGGGALPS